MGLARLYPGSTVWRISNLLKDILTICRIHQEELFNNRLGFGNGWLLKTVWFSAIELL